ncbi:oxidoreductase [Paenibacillus glycinis]|uniref:SDR family NAD(P)-dependent oxidoreductase n=1 Tax=Paenibacillus glycinis TaxID=2697035 RepID=A0ABW9XKR1_9BACL|nr:oxidoreductase [Paenibacillus glycinis]NBD23191.1 SDR family NAD(P)-dependent oxidoreductase [Paenibacillus glycinis]
MYLYSANETTPQAPIGSGFGPRSTAREVLAGRDLTGKIAIVTGGYSGIGLETTRVLAEAGATVIVPVRSQEKAQAALAGIPRVETERMELTDPASIDGFAERFLASGRPLHIVVNSAGIMANPLTRDARGYESQFATNHLGHFQLTARLWPALREAGGARVVAVTSRAHRLGGIDFDDPNFERREYDKWKAYAQSKTANALFALELDKLGKSSGVRAFSVHPGLIPTDIGRSLTDEENGVQKVTDKNGSKVGDANADQMKTVPQGAATSVWCATSSRLDGMGGVYCEDNDISEAVPADSVKGTGVRPWAIDPEAAKRLWTLSEALTGVKLND